MLYEFEARRGIEVPNAMCGTAPKPPSSLVVLTTMTHLLKESDSTIDHRNL